VGRRIAERLLHDDPELAGSFDVDAIEAACLAHDLGHPPFGHIAETELDRLTREKGVDGFEGNAQTFRIVTKLGIRHQDPSMRGFDLTGDTLDAGMKYPWLSTNDNAKTKGKWGAYTSEKDEFDRVKPGGQGKSIAAKIMDWADDITNAVHDTEDFFRAGLIPLHYLRESADEQKRFLDDVLTRWKNKSKPKPADWDKHYRGPFENIAPFFPRRCFDGTRRSRYSLIVMRNNLISRFSNSLQIDGARDVKIKDQDRGLVNILKELTWTYVIHSPALATQQEGQRRVVENLFLVFLESLTNGMNLVPTRHRHLVELIEVGDDAARISADILCEMTDAEALSLWTRISGISAASFATSVR
jgi:dGTPase